MTQESEASPDPDDVTPPESTEAPNSPRRTAPPPPDAGGSLRDRIAVLPGTDRVAYRPNVLLVELRVEAADDEATFDLADTELPELLVHAMETGQRVAPETVRRLFDSTPEAEAVVGAWFRLTGIADAPGDVGNMNVEFEWRNVDIHVELRSRLDFVYFASESCGCGCPPHPASVTSLMANPWSANPWSANPWSANPWSANPWSANPWSANPWSANAEALNIAATGKPPASSAMPALAPQSASPEATESNEVIIGILDSGLAGEVWNPTDHDWDQMCPQLLISSLVNGELDVPDAKIGGDVDGYLDPVAGHGTFIAGIIQQRVPGCEIHVGKVFHPEGDVDTSWLACRLWDFMDAVHPTIVNLSFGGAGTTQDGVFENAIRHFHEEHDVVFVAAAGNEGTCVAQYPAAMPEVIGVGALAPTGPAPWTNYGPWVDASAPGADIVSSFFANFDGELPRINGVDADNFDEWATWSGTSFAAPIVVAALAREISTTGCTVGEAVERVVRAPHLARFPNLGTVVNY